MVPSMVSTGTMDLPELLIAITKLFRRLGVGGIIVIDSWRDKPWGWLDPPHILKF